MLDWIIKLLLMSLLIFTPFALGSVEVWAFSTMELGILLIIVLWVAQSIVKKEPVVRHHEYRVPMLILGLFLCFVLLQMVSLPANVIRMISPKTYGLRQQLQVTGSAMGFTPISFFPHATKVEFFKWVILVGFFLFLLNWRLSDNGFRVTKQLALIILLVGSFESLFGMFKLFSGVTEESLGMGTFVNRNHFAGYLLMVIPLTIGFLFSRGAQSFRKSRHGLNQLSVLDGRSLLIGFSVVVMILGLIFSSSRMGILSLLFSFSLIILLVRNPQEGSRFSKRSALILGLAILWGASIGLDAVVSRFFLISDDLGTRQMIWRDTQAIVKDFPLVGTGLGTFTQVFPMHRSFHIRGLVTHAENDFLQLVSEVGIIGFGLVFVLFLILIVRAVLNIRSLSLTEPQRYLGIGGLVGILALMCHSVVERNIQVPANAFLWTFLWAIVLEAGTRKATKIS